MSWFSQLFVSNGNKANSPALENSLSRPSIEFKEQFSHETQEAVRKWVNRFFKNGSNNHTRFWRAQEKHFESNGSLGRPNDIIWGMLNQNKGPADVGTLLGMCELLMIEKKYQQCLVSAIELTYIQGSGADPIHKAQADSLGISDEFEDISFIGSACIPYISISAVQIKMGISDVEGLFISEAEKHRNRLGKYGPEITPRAVWKMIENDLSEALALSPKPPRYRATEPVLSVGG